MFQTRACQLLLLDCQVSSWNRNQGMSCPFFYDQAFMLKNISIEVILYGLDG